MQYRRMFGSLQAEFIWSGVVMTVSPSTRHSMHLLLEGGAFRNVGCSNDRDHLCDAGRVQAPEQSETGCAGPCSQHLMNSAIRLDRR